MQMGTHYANLSYVDNTTLSLNYLPPDVPLENYIVNLVFSESNKPYIKTGIEFSIVANNALLSDEMITAIGLSSMAIVAIIILVAAIIIVLRLKKGNKNRFQVKPLEELTEPNYRKLIFDVKNPYITKASNFDVLYDVLNYIYLTLDVE